MNTHLLEGVLINPASRDVYEKQENLLAATTEELASLSFSIILTARWEASASEDVERRHQLRAELVDLRRQYSQKIDEIAMTSGIQKAMDAKEEVEHTVSVPTGMDLLFVVSEDGNLHS